MKPRIGLCVILLIVVFLIAPLSMFAQDTPAPIDTPAVSTEIPTLEPTLLPTEPTSPVEPESPVDVVPVDQAAHELVTTVMAILGSVFSAPFTLLLVSWLKRVPQLNSISARTLQLAVAVILVVATWIARFAGVSVQLSSFLNAIQVAGPPVLQFILTLLGSHAAYNYAVSQDVVMVGYKRPDSSLAAKSLTVRSPKGQGLVEYALILVLVAVVVIAILALLGPQIGNVFSSIVSSLQCGGICTPVP